MSQRFRERPSPLRRLRGQMLAVLLGFGLVPLLALGTSVWVANREWNQERTRNVLEAMVKNRRATIELFLAEKLRLLRVTAAAHPIEELQDSRFLERLLSELQRSGGAIVDLGLIGEHGRHLAYAGPYDLTSANYLDQPWFAQVMVHGSAATDVFLGFRRFPHMVMAVRKREEGRTWILRATIDTDVLSQLVREGGLETGADVFILNRAGEFQTRYDPAHRLMERAETGPVPAHSGVRVVPLRDGAERALVATAWLTGGDWVLVARQPVPGASVLLDAHPAVLVVFLTCLMLVPLLSVLVTRRRLRQIRDMQSERAALYETVAQTQKMAAVGRLAAGIAHEINNPLAIIHAQVGLMGDILDDHPDLPEAEEFRRRVDTICEQVERARGVTHGLLGFSRRVGPAVEPVNVVAALEETLRFVEKELEAAKIRVVRSYGDVPLIRSRLGSLQQVFLNLVNNALDVVGTGGEVRLAVQPGADGGVRVEIADNGPGIPERDRERIFEPFFTTKSGSTEHTGLGLAICREIVHGLGGRIELSTEVGRGTAFVLQLPLEMEV